MKIEGRNISRKLRMKGYSINQISRDTGYSKSSVSLWTRDIVLTSEQRSRLSEKGRSVESIERRRMSRLKNENTKRRLVIDLAKSDYSSISKEELKIIGTILYLGEGAKTKKNVVSVANSDPAVILIMLRFFREICGTLEKKFRLQIHTHEHSDIKEVERYWSRITKIPTSQFYKTYVKASSASLNKRHTLKFGTVDLSINDTTTLLKILGWIEKIKELLLK